MKPVEADDYTVAVVGAGAMGQGIVQVSAQGGMRTLIYDAKAGAATAAKETIAKRILRLAEKGRLTAEEADAAIARMEAVASVADLKDADTVVEAIFEDIDVKQALFKEIEAVVSRDCIICSNTSSIPIAAIGRACEHRDRIGGLHFFNPVPLMKLVEVIRAAETSDATVAALTAVGKRMTRVPVTVKDSPGFLVNLGGRSFTTEGLRIAHDQVASPSQIDAIMRDCCGFRMGPFELMDLTGIDVNYPVSQIIYNGYNQDPRLKTSPNHKAMFDAGTFGRKTGQGWYRYADGAAVAVPSPDHAPNVTPAKSVAIIDDDEKLRDLCDALDLKVISDDGAVPLLAAPVGDDATHTALIEDVDFQRIVCIDTMFDTSKRVTLMTPPGADPSIVDAVAAAVTASGRKATVIKDSPGFVSQRICAMIGNLGCFMAEIGLASPDDIDTAMELGLNYPLGPLKLVDKMQPEATLAIMEALHDLTGDPRYRPTLWLRRRAELGLPIHETVSNPN